MTEVIHIFVIKYLCIFSFRGSVAFGRRAPLKRGVRWVLSSCLHALSLLRCIQRPPRFHLKPSSPILPIRPLHPNPPVASALAVFSAPPPAARPQASNSSPEQDVVSYNTPPTPKTRMHTHYTHTHIHEYNCYCIWGGKLRNAQREAKHNRWTSVSSKMLWVSWYASENRTQERVSVWQRLWAETSTQWAACPAALSRTADDLVVKQTTNKGFLTSFNQPTYRHLNLDSAKFFSYWCQQLSPGNASLSSYCIDQHEQACL